MAPVSHFDFESSELRRYEALLHMADLVCHRGLDDLFPDISQRLRQVVPFDLITFALHDPATNMMKMSYLEGAANGLFPSALPVEEAPSGLVWQSQQPLIISELSAENRFIDALRRLREVGIQSYCCLPLTTSQRRLGGLGLGSRLPHIWDEQELRLLQRVAELIALSIENVQTSHALGQEKDRLQMLLEVNTALLSNLDLRQLFPAISASLRKIIKQDFASVALYDEATQSLRLHALDYSLAELGSPGMLLPLKGTGAGQAFLQRELKIFDEAEIRSFHFPHHDRLIDNGLKSGCCVPLISRNGPLGTLNLGSLTENAFLSSDAGLLKQVAAQVAVALDNARAYSEIAELRDKLSEEKMYLQDEIRSEMNFEEIIGESKALKRILDAVKTAAPSDATVLILGETGTGKELIARAIHRMSLRKDAAFIKMNCAAIPTGLLESELFGHEKGAFTGAITQKVGRLELADNGTMFLDEVGDIPLELQPKLLRALQDQEFERLGSNRTIRVNVRLIAATNRDLGAAIANKEFRSDLYYRLNVFPVRAPALRERKEDIPLLVRYFVQKFARRMGKVIERIPAQTMNTLANWNWPGNVRELENFIERSVILSESSVLNAPAGELSVPEETEEDGTLESLEREYIIRVLRETGGVIAGVHGAAARLGLKRTTLQSRIQRMGISRREYGS